MRSVAALLLFLLADDPRIADGIKLHDRGQYEEAVAQYRAVLADDPKNEMAAYELALSLEAQGKYPECRAAIEPLSKRKGSLQGPALTVLGNCLDGGGDAKAAAAVYKRGMKIRPDDPNLLYNYAVTLVRLGNYDEARKLLKKELTLRPDHASGHYALAQVFQHQGFRGPAVLSYLRMFAYELGTTRAKEASQNLVALLGAGVSSADGKNVTITVDASPRTDEGDYGGWQMMMAFAAGARDLGDNEKKNEFDKTRGQIHTSLLMLLETADKGRDFTAKQNIPFFAALDKEKLLETYTAAAILPLDLPGEATWVEANRENLQKLAAFIAKYRSR
ncbi:MAG TPA: tetratricopeptide repeat protein [Thermoanaerobaculia bacterium]|jgi:tetratricopeptide (TPR) repeat protein